MLRQFGFQQNIPRSPESLPMSDIPTIDLNRLRYVEHAIIGVTKAHEPSACADGYLVWFRRVSQPYITPANNDDRPSLTPRMRRHLRKQSLESGLLGIVAYQRTTEKLQVARRSIEEYEPNTSRGARHVRERASFS
ncbi:hypothetical protein LR48_Vigan02g100500 [Vigna angularis]|uniref:Uncharacterized protein n=1 Tax=Phaseolus angularis TaxID=3914 RepID=A0A0L9TWC7_PHAAN|nr:hypothetical protein LR48_Vigan02g100500 [Vigna angularis]